MSQLALLPTQVVDSVTLLDAIGNTPLIRLPVKDERGGIWVKLESANPTGSYKDRMALAMIRGDETGGWQRARPWSNTPVAAPAALWL